jgi:hypothetical protein
MTRLDVETTFASAFLSQETIPNEPGWSRQTPK